MKKIILFSIIAFAAVTFSSYAQTIIVFGPPVDCDSGGCGGGTNVCCANTNLTHT